MLTKDFPHDFPRPRTLFRHCVTLPSPCPPSDDATSSERSPFDRSATILNGPFTPLPFGEASNFRRGQHAGVSGPRLRTRWLGRTTAARRQGGTGHPARSARSAAARRRGSSRFVAGRSVNDEILAFTDRLEKKRGAPSPPAVRAARPVPDCRWPGGPVAPRKISAARRQRPRSPVM